METLDRRFYAALTLYRLTHGNYPELVTGGALIDDEAKQEFIELVIEELDSGVIYIDRKRGASEGS